MTRIDQFVLRYNAWLILVAAVGYNLSVEHLMDRSYSAPSLLLYRGLAGGAFIAIIAWRQGISLIPRAPRTQVVRFLNSGIAVLLAFEAFHRLAGVTVATIQRLDVPFAVILGVVLGQRLRDGKFGLSLLVTALVLSSFFFAGRIEEDPIGLALALLAVGMTSVAYLLGKKSLSVENNLTVLNTTNLGCFGVGLLVCVLRGHFSPVHLADLWLFGVITITQFLLNYVMAVLFRHHDITRAQRPYLLSAVGVLLLEMLTEHKLFAPLHIVFVLLVVGIVYLITLPKAPSLRWPTTQAETKSEQAVSPA